MHENGISGVLGHPRKEKPNRAGEYQNVAAVKKVGSGIDKPVSYALGKPNTPRDAKLHKFLNKKC